MERFQHTAILDAVGDVTVIPAPGPDRKLHLTKVFVSVSYRGTGIELSLGNGVDEAFWAVQGEIDFYPLDFGEEGYDLGWNNPLIFSLNGHANTLTLSRIIAIGYITGSR
jgi:hypothetical protein